MSLCLLSFDVEDWFHVERMAAAIPRARWSAQEVRVERGVDRILAVLAERGVTATFFVLGWVARRCAGLVARIAAGGHEIASHGFHHQPLWALSPAAFAADVGRSKALLEDLAGAPVVGYRAPTFSMQAWALPILKAQGFLYDSSYFPGAYRHAAPGLPPHRLVGVLEGGLGEAQIPSLPLFGRAVPWGGSGYFRACPYPVFRAGVRRIVTGGGDFVFYLHPWELDPGQPRPARLGWRDRFRQYHGLAGTEGKLRRLVRDFSFEPIGPALRRRLAVAAFARRAMP